MEWTEKKRIDAVFDGKIPDKIPWISNLAYWQYAQEKQNLLKDCYKDWGLVKLHRELDCAVYAPLARNWEINKKGIRIEDYSDGNEQAALFHTPFGTLKAKINYMPMSYSTAITEWPFKNIKDLEALKYMIENETAVYNKELENIESKFGEQGIVVLEAPRSPLARFLVELAGTENTIYFMHDYPEKFEEILALISLKQDQIYKILLEHPAHYVMLPDNLSSDTTSPGLFSKFSLGYYRLRCKQIKIAGKHSMVHHDGYLKGLIDIVSRSGLDCIQAVTQYPAGDLTVDEIINSVSKNVIVWGGVPGALLSNKFPLDKFIDVVTEYIQKMKKRGNVILGLADQVPPDGVLDRLVKVRELVDQYGRYDRF